MPLLPRHRVEAAAFRARATGRFAVHPLAVSDRTRLTDDAVAITFAVPEELRAAYRYDPGQHLVILHAHAGAVARRSYSICSSATGDELRIGVKRIPGGAFSPYATDSLRVGDVLHVMVPTGSFAVPFGGGGSRHYAAVAAGSGITPILSIVATALEVESDSRVTLLYGNRTRSSTMFLDELQTLERCYPGRLALTHVLSREDGADLGAIRGRIGHSVLDAVFGGQEVDEWFLCGPEVLMEEIIDHLAGRGVEPDRVHRELFVSAVGAVAHVDDRPDIVSDVLVRLNGIETELAVASRGDSILAAALAVRDDLPYACLDGICSTCRARVVQGDVVMDRRSGLDRREVDEGYVLVCQAHPLTRTVVLDFDR